MKISKIQSDYVNRDSGHERKLGRYWASDIYSIKAGYLLPEDFFAEEKKRIDSRGVGMILTGVAMEDMQEKIWRTQNIDFEYGDKTKREIKITDEIVLVVKPDFLFPDFLIETKYPFTRFPLRSETIPIRYCYQLECEYRAFYKPVYLGVFSIPFKLQLVPYIPSKRRWQNIKTILIDFHEKLKRL